MHTSKKVGPRLNVIADFIKKSLYRVGILFGGTGIQTGCIHEGPRRCNTSIRRFISSQDQPCTSSPRRSSCVPLHNFFLSYFHGTLLGPSTLDTIGVPASKTTTLPPPPSASETQSTYAAQLAEVPEFASYGAVLNSSSKPAQLTESETEYQVTCVKHIFKEHVVFQVCTIFFSVSLQ